MKIKKLQYKIRLFKRVMRNFFLFILICSFKNISLPLPAAGQFIAPPPVRTPQNVKVNHTLPAGILKPGEQIVAHFSTEPTDEEIFRVHVFEEPLVPMEGDKNGKENVALVNTLAAFSQRTSQDDFSAITDFLETYPESRWRGALLTNLGIVYRRTGYFTLAMNSWQEAWDLIKDQKESKIKTLADRALAELLSIHSWVGEFKKMESLLNEIEDRIIEGNAVNRVVSSREAVWIMKNRPEGAFKCGPYALHQIIAVKYPLNPINEKLKHAQSPQQGFSLAEVQKMSIDAGLNYQMAFRKPGAEIILNAVVHWKLNHYSALIKKENGYYLCEDATVGARYGQQFWVTPPAFDEEASGYFLVPTGKLPKGWRSVNTNEGNRIFGKGEPGADDKGLTNCDKQTCPPPPNCKEKSCPVPMAQCNVHLASVSLHIFDSPVSYNPPRGPFVMFDVGYHQRDSYQPANFNYSNLGPKWTFGWLSYVVDHPANASADVDMYWQGGGIRTFRNYNSGSSSYAPEIQSKDVLVRISDACYELRHSDGSKDIYGRPDGSSVVGRKVFMTHKVNVLGDTLSLLYDNSLKIIGLKDGIGQVTTISYGLTNSYKIDSVIDPFGRIATFEYDNIGRLIKIKDVIGIVSAFKYDASDFIIQMTTPYGVTSFVKGEKTDGVFRSLETTFPLGEKERVEFPYYTPTMPTSDPVAIVPSGMFTGNDKLEYRNTFFWDKKAMKEAQGDYSKARIYHWIYGGQTTDFHVGSPILESIKDPLENRVWYYYQGTTDNTAVQGMSSAPAIIGQVLQDGTSQLTKYTYNILDAVKSSTDPLGRKDSFIYDANNIDLLEVRQTTSGANDLLAKYTYNAQHLPLTSIDAAGQKTLFTYNTHGQLLTSTNPKNEITTLTYDPDGYLSSVTGAIPGATVSFTYDGFGRVRTITDPEGYKITADYDALDRPTLITFPDSTFEQILYDRLDAVHMRDRMGRWSHTTFDSLDRPIAMQDALGRITQLFWCSCGSLEAIADPLKHITSFVRDLQGRVTSKIYPDGKVISYDYDTTGRLIKVIDSKNQQTNYQYFNDDNVKKISYSNAAVATPSVSFTYDTKFNRIATMTDTTGTTTYNYNPISTTPKLGAGQLRMIDGPTSPTNDTIHFNYDSLGRIVSRSINGTANSTSVLFDKLGRVTSSINLLGNFTYTYLNQTNQLLSITSPNGPTTTFDYFDNNGDRRLKQILNKKGSTTLSKFNYEYNAEGQITKWIQKAGSATPNYYELGYDLSDQLVSAVLKNQSTSAIVKRYAYNYDKAGNRTSEQIDNGVTSAIHNDVNQLTSQTEGGPFRLKGTVDEFSAVKVSSETTSSSDTATVINNVFEASVNVVPGTNTVDITATDYSGNYNQKIGKYQFTVINGVNKTLTYDNNGNTTNIQDQTSNIQYTWDAADRLVKITKGGNTTEFVYDGLSRQVAEKLNGAIIKRWLWCGTEMCEERNAGGGTVTKRFYAQGEKIGTAKYFFTRDHLGSIREMTDNSGAVKARYDYDPYGRRTLVTGTDTCDFGFTGHYFHKTSGLHLALYRTYEANLARWLSRDPIEEKGGINLYSYAANGPSNNIDSLGLFPGEGFIQAIPNLLKSAIAARKKRDEAIKNQKCTDDIHKAFDEWHKDELKATEEFIWEASSLSDWYDMGVGFGDLLLEIPGVGDFFDWVGESCAK